MKSGSLVISSLSARESQCATQNSPLIIQSNPGQKINITLIDYNWGGTGFDIQRKRCQQLYGHIVSYDTSDILEICGGSTRVKHVHTASSHMIQIAFDESALQHYTFLLKIQGKTRSFIQKNVLLSKFSKSDTLSEPEPLLCDQIFGKNDISDVFAEPT